MEQVLLRTEIIKHGRNKGMRTRLYGEASPFDGTMKAVPDELRICKGIGRLLEFHYPGHPWMVDVDTKQGYAKVSIPALLGPNWGYIILLNELTDKEVIKAGGEILERFRIPRSTIDLARYAELEQKVPLLGIFRARDRHRIPA